MESAENEMELARMIVQEVGKTKFQFRIDRWVSYQVVIKEFKRQRKNLKSNGSGAL